MHVYVQVSLSTNICCNKWEEISDLKIFPECFRGPLKTLCRATCGRVPLIVHPWARDKNLYPSIFRILLFAV